MQEALAKAKEEEERLKREAQEKERKREEAIKAKLEKVSLNLMPRNWNTLKTRHLTLFLNKVHSFLQGELYVY